MLGRTESEELRALQEKAYGRGGVLTGAESDRLRELEDARLSAFRAGPVTAHDVRAVAHDAGVRDVSATPASEGAPTGHLPHPVADTVDAGPIQASTVATNTAETGPIQASTAASNAAETGPVQTNAEGTPPIPHDPTPDATLLGTLRRHATAAVVAVAVLLAVGLGVGWALFAPRTASIPLTGEQQQRRAELAADVFDPGSVRAIAQKDGALAWFATQDDGELICLILDVGAQSQTDCAPSTMIERGLGATLSVPTAVSAEDDLFGGASGGEAVYASLFLSTAGEPMVGIQRWSASSSFMEQFEGEELLRAEALAAEGYEHGLSLVGSFRGEPVWLADRLASQGATERCLLVDATEGVACESFGTALTEGLSTHVVDVAPDGSVASVSVVELRFTGQQTPYLTVTVDAPVSLVAPGDSVVIPGPPGDPIEVETPNDGTGG